MKTARKSATSDQVKALAKFLEVKTSEITEESDNRYSHGREEYLVLTDEEADAMAREQIIDSLWAFNAEFIASHTKNGLNDLAIKSLKEMQGKLCESANDLVRSMIDDLEHFVDDAISSDGRGHFLSGYDGEENDQDGYFIYRTN